jgi:hypothetical protein
VKTRPNVVISATVNLFWEQAVSCHQDTQAPLFELAVDVSVDNAKGWIPGDATVEITAGDLEASLETVIDRAKRQIERLRAATELRGEA